MPKQKYNCEALVEIEVEVNQGVDSDQIIEAVKDRLRALFKNKHTSKYQTLDVSDKFKIIIVSKVK